MKLKNKIDIDDLSFGVVMPKLSYQSKKERTDLEAYNLFELSTVKFAVARWVVMKPEDRKYISNPLMYVFGDVWSRSQYEMIICPWPPSEDEHAGDGRKVDLYQMYVLPNEDLLFELINRVSKSSAQRYLREWRNKYRRK